MDIGEPFPRGSILGFLTSLPATSFALGWGVWPTDRASLVLPPSGLADGAVSSPALRFTDGTCCPFELDCEASLGLDAVDSVGVGAGDADEDGSPCLKKQVGRLQCGSGHRAVNSPSGLNMLFSPLPRPALGDWSDRRGTSMERGERMERSQSQKMGSPD